MQRGYVQFFCGVDILPDCWVSCALWSNPALAAAWKYS